MVIRSLNWVRIGKVPSASEASGRRRHGDDRIAGTEGYFCIQKEPETEKEIWSASSFKEITYQVHWIHGASGLS